MSSHTEPLAELVITPPGVYGPAFAERFLFRMTFGVLIQLVVKAQRHIIVSAPFLQQGYGLSAGSLAEAVQAALQRGVDVDVMSTGQGLQSINHNWLTHQARGTLRLFRPAANISNKNELGSHAKFCVSDGQSAYIGSANLTDPAMTRHLELGLLVNGHIAKQVEEMWRYSLEVGIFIEQYKSSPS